MKHLKKEDSKPTQTTTPANTEKYVRNDEMINKIRVLCKTMNQIL